MALRLVTGFEQGSVAGITNGALTRKYADQVFGTAVSVSVTTSSPRTGAYALHLVGVSTGTAAAVNWGTDTLATAQTRLLLTFAFKFPSSLPPADTPISVMHSFASDPGIWFITSRDGRTNVIAVSFDDANFFYSVQSVTTGVWYYLEAHLDVSANPHVVTWRLDGLEAQQATAAVAASTIAEFDIGYRGGTRDYTVDYDDVTAWTDTANIPYIGRHKVQGVFVDGAGTVTVTGSTANFSTFAGATPTLTAWNATTARNNIDEVPPNLTTAQDGFTQTTVGVGTQYVEIPMTTYTIGTSEKVTGARLVVCGWQQTTGSCDIGVRSWNGTTETIVAPVTANIALGNNTTTPGWICGMLTTADINTQTKLDALAFRVGFSTDATPDIGVQNIIAEVAIAEGTRRTGPTRSWQPINRASYY